MKNKRNNKMFAVVVKCLLLCFFVNTAHASLNENCVISVLNRTIYVAADGNWSLPNVPANQGGVRARATCTDELGVTTSGQSAYFTVLENGITRVGEIVFEDLDPIPTVIDFSSSDTILLNAIGATVQLTVTASYADGSNANVTSGDLGTNYSSTNMNVATVSPQGLVTAAANGFVLISARKDGVLATRAVQIITAGDFDGDGLPDDYEVSNGLNPNDPIDAFEDNDNDGLSALAEFNAGTSPVLADTDGDSIDDGEELSVGNDGFITNPLLADSDGDGLSDAVEIAVASDPNDSNDANFTAALISIESTPSSIVLTFNGIDSEVSTQLSIVGTLIDGSQIDLTTSVNTTYSSSDITVVSFGSTTGEIFGGQTGNAIVTVTSSGKTVDIEVTVQRFTQAGLSSIEIPGYANNVDISGDYAYIASGSAGLQVVDVTDRSNPQIVGSLDTDGTAIDVKVLGNLVYLADGETGLKIIDISNPLAPVLLGGLDTAGVAQ